MAGIYHRSILFAVFLLAAVMFAAVIGQVIFRYIFQFPLPWSEELARYLMVWVTALGAAEAYRTNSHVGVSLLVDQLPAGKRTQMKMAAHLAVLVLMAVIAFQGFKLSWLLLDQNSPALQIPMTWPYLAVPVGAALIAAQALIQIVRIRKEAGTAAAAAREGEP